MSRISFKTKCPQKIFYISAEVPQNNKFEMAQIAVNPSQNGIGLGNNNSWKHQN